MAYSEDHQIIAELRERTARVEVKLDYVISNMSSLPPSPATIAELDEIKGLLKEQKEIIVEHGDFIKTLKERIAWVTAAFSAITAIAVYGGQWLLENLKIGWGGN